MNQQSSKSFHNCSLRRSAQLKSPLPHLHPSAPYVTAGLVFLPWRGPECLQCGIGRHRQGRQLQLFAPFLYPGLLCPGARRQRVYPWLDLPLGHRPKYS